MKPTLPKTIDEWQERVNSINYKTDNNEQFSLIHYVDLHLMIFLCDKNLKLLCQTDIVYMDGTFEYCPKFFTQLLHYSHDLCNNHNITLLFALI